MKEFDTFWNSLPQEIQEYLKKCVKKSETEEQFISEIMVGDCPECGNNNTMDCDDIEGVEDPTLGLCKDCGYFWCIECGSQLLSNFNCEHWKICEQCKESKDEFGFCGVMAWECKHIEEWLNKEAAALENTCAWCKKEIPEDTEVFGFGAKAKKGVNLNGKEGNIIPLLLINAHREVSAIVVTKDSQAKKEGYDFMFMACSQKCAKSLKTALNAETKLFDAVG